jgi:hypothetical protein
VIHEVNSEHFMTPFTKATVPDSEKEAAVAALLAKWRDKDSPIAKLLDTDDESIAVQRITSVVEGEQNNEIYLNDTYQVSLRRLGEIIHLSIKRIDREPVHDWRELQQIKTELVGPECEAVELYPAESRVIDTANQYHLWAVPDSSFRFPFGFESKRVVTDESIAGSKQRPLDTK